MSGNDVRLCIALFTAAAAASAFVFVNVRCPLLVLTFNPFKQNTVIATISVSVY